MVDTDVHYALAPMKTAIAAAHHDLVLQRRSHKARKAALAKQEEVMGGVKFELDEHGHIAGIHVPGEVAAEEVRERGG